MLSHMHELLYCTSINSLIKFKLIDVLITNLSKLRMTVNTQPLCIYFAGYTKTWVFAEERVRHESGTT